MPQVICTRPNASTMINGVKFEPYEHGGMISEDISDDQAKAFLRIPGYSLEGDQEQTASGQGDEGLDELQKKAESLGIKVNPRWKHDRLNAEIAKAEEAAAGAAKQAAAGDNQDNTEAA